MNGIKVYILTTKLVFCSFLMRGQSGAPYFSYDKGMGITTPDSSFSIHTRFRIQNRIAFSSESSKDLNVSEVEARIRRMRLRFNGFVLSSRLTYFIQLSFTRSDMDFETTNFPNIIRDAYIQYSFNKCFSVGLGQTKLPGNRQRIISSGDLQFSDRSIVNSALNIDRDFGVQFCYKKEYFVLRGAISSGEGRNINTSDHGLAYTGRLELLPLGTFVNGSDYFEGDLTRHKRPKVSIGVVYHFNENAFRSGGQTGYMLQECRDLKTRMLDVLFKYKGWAFSGEYLQRLAPNPLVKDVQGFDRVIYAGAGQNYQLSYVFKNSIEVVGRYSALQPGKAIEAKEKAKEQFTLGLNKYLKGHRVKFQNDLTLERWHITGTSNSGDFWRYTFQIELGI